MHIIAYQKRLCECEPGANLQIILSSPDAQLVAAKVLLQTVLLRSQSVIVRFSARIALFFRHKVKTSVDHPQFFNQYT